MSPKDDITRKALQEIRAQAEDKRLLQLATLGHELKTPLTALSGYSETLAGEHLGPIDNQAYKEYATIIHRASGQLLDICNRLIDSYSGTPPVANATEVDATEVIGNIVSLFSSMAEQKHVTINTEIAADFPLLKVDPARLTAVLTEVVSNAIKYTPDGKSVTIKAKLNENRDAVILVIQDEGRGISPENLLNATRPGFRTYDAQNGIDGSGLGLFMVEEHMRAMGGTLDIQSKKGIGTIVSLMFPEPYEQKA